VALTFPSTPLPAKTGDEQKSHGATVQPKLSTFAVVLVLDDLDGSAGLNRDILGFGSDRARRRTGAAERDGMDRAVPSARRRPIGPTASARCWSRRPTAIGSWCPWSSVDLERWRG